MNANRLALGLSLAWIGLCIVLAVTADLLPLPDSQDVDLRARLQPPLGWGGSWTHPLGTDELGRDILSRLVASLRISLLLALIGTVTGALLGTLLGFLGAHFRGFVDDALMVLIDAQASMPFFVIALVAIAIFGTDLSLFVILLCLYGWERYARLARAMALSAQEQGYVEGLRAIGAGPVRIYMRHILPNVASSLIVAATLNFPETILLESALSFLGLGVQPPLTSLGNMLGYGRDYMLSAWWVVLWPAIAIFLSTLSMGLIGDWLRDRLDPNLD